MSKSTKLSRKSKHRRRSRSDEEEEDGEILDSSDSGSVILIEEAETNGDDDDDKKVPKIEKQEVERYPGVKNHPWWKTRAVVGFFQVGFVANFQIETNKKNYTIKIRLASVPHIN